MKYRVKPYGNECGEWWCIQRWTLVWHNLNHHYYETQEEALEEAARLRKLGERYED